MVLVVVGKKKGAIFGVGCGLGGDRVVHQDGSPAGTSIKLGASTGP